MARLTCFVFDTQVHEDLEFYDSPFMDGLAEGWVNNRRNGGTILKASAIEPISA